MDGKFVCALVDCATNKDLLLDEDEQEETPTIGLEVTPCLDCGCVHIFFGTDERIAKYRLDLDFNAVRLLTNEIIERMQELRRMMQGLQHQTVNDNIN